MSWNIEAWCYKILAAPGLAWQTVSKKVKVKLDVLTDINMLLTVEKGITGGICHAIYRYAKALQIHKICKYMKDYSKNKESSLIQYWDVNNKNGWAMLQNLPVNNSKWTKDSSQ